MHTIATYMSVWVERWLKIVKLVQIATGSRGQLQDLQ
jgi:hypothetical protein